MIELLISKDQFNVFDLDMSECGILKYRMRTIYCGLCVFDDDGCNLMHNMYIKQYCMTKIW